MKTSAITAAWLAASTAFAGIGEFYPSQNTSHYPPPPPPPHWDNRGWQGPPPALDSPRRGEFEMRDRGNWRGPPPHHSHHGGGDGWRAPPPQRSPYRPSTPKGYVLAGTLHASGGVECGNPASKPIKTVRVVCTSGSVVINTMVVREGAAKTQIPVSVRLSPGQSQEIPLGGHRAATGLRFGTSGGGTFSVFVH